MQPAAIINRGRGPEIQGTRITVYTIIDYLKMDWHRDLIAVELGLSSTKVQAAIDYIEEHKVEVMAAYQRILERSANAKNPPEIEAKRKEGHKKLVALRKQLKEAKERGESIQALARTEKGRDLTGLIIDRGRGPEIAGTRITVYRILDFLGLGWHRDLIAAHLRLSSDQVQAAIDCIEANKEEIMAEYHRILERSANAKNPPEFDAKRPQSRAKLKAFMQQARRKKVKETARDRHPRGQ